ncbi:MAG: L-2-hydroxyglutarate oxidase [Euzebya sp.]
MPAPICRGKEVVVIGAGLVGLATADALLQSHPELLVTVLEKESHPAAHQSGRNSGVIHSGVYYPPGSAKAVTCRKGRELLLRFAAEHDVPHELCGKVVVAVTDAERPALAEIARRGAANGVTAELINGSELSRLEPHVRGVQALRVDNAGIIDFPAVARALAQRVVSAGGAIRTDAAVQAGTERDDVVRVRTTTGDIEADVMVSCAGLHSDRVASMFTAEPLPVRIVGFRGEYRRLTPAAAGLCRNLIYPVPDARFPFLGVHLTRQISGEVLAGPNAVLALSREGYTWGRISMADMADVVGFSGMRRLAAMHWRTGIGEMWRSVNTAAFVRALQQMTPDITAADLLPHRSGVRAQALFADGTLADDFVFHRTPRTVHVLNAPSPAATAALAIGQTLAAEVAERLR